VFAFALDEPGNSFTQKLAALPWDYFCTPASYTFPKEVDYIHPIDGEEAAASISQRMVQIRGSMAI
jgi:hypothetical protein